MKFLYLCLLSISLFLGFSDYKTDNQKSENIQTIGFGKIITITVSETEVVDADFLEKVIDEDIKKDILWFDMLDNSVLEELINYMRINDFEIVPGKYNVNQAWRFKNGKFIINDNGTEVEVFTFKKKQDV